MLSNISILHSYLIICVRRDIWPHHGSSSRVSETSIEVTLAVMVTTAVCEYFRVQEKLLILCKSWDDNFGQNVQRNTGCFGRDVRYLGRIYYVFYNIGQVNVKVHLLQRCRMGMRQ